MSTPNENGLAYTGKEDRTMTKHGKQYDAKGTDATARGIRNRRAVYLMGCSPTIEQDRIIAVLEEGFQGNWNGKDPYEQMRRAEALGIEIVEEELLPNGKWASVTDPDVAITNMTAGAL